MVLKINNHSRFTMLIQPLKEDLLSNLTRQRKISKTKFKMMMSFSNLETIQIKTLTSPNLVLILALNKKIGPN